MLCPLSSAVKGDTRFNVDEEVALVLVSSLDEISRRFLHVTLCAHFYIYASAFFASHPAEHLVYE